MVRLPLAAFLTLLALSTIASGDVIVLYDFTVEPGNQTATAPDTIDSLATASHITRGDGISPYVDSDSMNSVGWSRSSTLDISDNEYYEFTVAPTSGYSLTLDRLYYRDAIDSTGPLRYAIRTSLDEYASNATSGSWPFAPASANHTVYLSSMGDTFADLTSPVTFRFYGWDSGSTTGGEWWLENGTEGGLKLTGTVQPAAIPEPSSIVALASMGLIGLGIAWRKRRRKAG